MTTKPTYYQDPALKRTTEVPAADWDSETNRAGSMASGIGIDIAGGVVEVNDFTLLDQNEDARNPQLSSHIGHAPTAINAEDPADLNDTVSLNDLAIGWVENEIA